VKSFRKDGTQKPKANCSNINIKSELQWDTKNKLAEKRSVLEQPSESPKKSMFLLGRQEGKEFRLEQLSESQKE
jgi:hypothetical protein